MSDPSSDSPLARLFVALELPAEVRAGIAHWGARALRDPALREVPEEALHITLVFLGEVPDERIHRIAAVLLGVEAEAPRIELSTEPVSLPRGRRPGLFALEARSEGTEEIRAALASALTDAGLFEPDERPFWPHVTVARVRGVRGQRRKARKVEDSPGRLPQALSQPFCAVRLALYLSSFGPDGVHYAPLAQVELASGEAAVR
jgi:2'-5' RNA ligase